jgi:nucleotide-binding universal stress UspA family protein
MAASAPATIVVGVDGSPQSLQALDWAAKEALARKRPLHIVHALLWPLLHVPLRAPEFGLADGVLQKAAREILFDASERARLAAPDLDIATDLPMSSPAGVLISESQNAELVVVGHRGLGGFASLLVGSVGVQTAAHAQCPVVVVRSSDKRPEPARTDTGQVVVGVDGAEISRQAIGFAFDYAARHGLGVTAVHAYHWPFLGAIDPALGDYTPADLHADHYRLLAEALAEFVAEYPDVPAQCKIAEGRPGEVLVAESAGAALTVVGSRGRGGFAGLLLGSTSQDVLHHASGTVAVVRAAPEPERGQNDSAR